MANFSASDAAMTGFAVVRRRPIVLLWWMLFHTMFIGSISIILVVIAGPAFTQMVAMQAAHTANDPENREQAIAMFRQVSPAYFLLLPIMLVFYSVLYTAMNRAVLRPSETAFGYLRLGWDELRQFGLFLLTFLVALCAYIGVAILAAIFMVVMAFASRGAQPWNGAGGWIGLLLGLGLLFAWIYVTTRLSLATALTFDTKKVNLFGAWALTHGQFWRMFSSYVLSFFLALIVGVLGMIVLVACSAIAGGGVGAMAFIFRPDMSSLAAYMSPVRVVYIVLSGALYGLIWPVVLTPRAAIYKILMAKAAPTPASWPSPPLETPPPAPVAADPDALGPL